MALPDDTGPVPTEAEWADIAERARVNGQADLDAHFADPQADYPITPPEKKPRKRATPKVPKEMPSSDVGNALRFRAEYGDRVRYVPQLKSWFYWAGSHWQRDDMGRIPKLIVDMAYGLAQYALDERDSTLLKAAIELQKAGRIAACEQLARLLDGLQVHVQNLDQHPLRLACPNGTVNLENGSLVPATPRDLLTHLCPTPYTPDASAPTWEYFLEQILPPDVRHFLQKWFGYCLTASMIEQCFVVLYGTGANGKSTLTQTIRRVVGPLVGHLPLSAFTPQYGGGLPPGQSLLVGLRCALLSETEYGQFLTESFVKQLTGGEEIVVKRLYENPFATQPTAKIVIVANHMPRIRGTDDGFWRRVLKVNFDTVIPEAHRDRHLADRLYAEAQGILAWLVRGAVLWQQEGLTPPPAVLAATSAYRTQEDTVAGFLDEKLEVVSGARISTTDAYRAYTDYCREQGMKGAPIRQRDLTEALVERGYELSKSHGRGYLNGLQLPTFSSRPEELN